MTALFVGGSEELSETISLILKVRWQELNLFHVTEATEATELIHRREPDIVLLHFDSESPHCFALISQIRSFSNVPIIVLSETNDVMNKVRALQVGADDWISLSSIPMEFIAKVNAILRRCSPDSNRRISSFLNGRLSIDYATREVCILGKQVKLTPIEYKILSYLAENQGRVVSSAELLRCVWGPNYQGDTEILKISICRLRSKIEQNPSNPEIILTERGVGYAITPFDSTYQPAAL